MIVLPEPASWHRALVAGEADAHELFAPWALVHSVPAVAPGLVRAFAARRRLTGARSVPGFPLAEGALRLWSRGRADRILRARFLVRRAVDRLAAARVRRLRPERVIAPSCAARQTFAAARAVGARCLLVEDLPDIRGLHRDLDRAARAHPECAFLHRYRAPDAVLVQQEVERVLADAIYVRGRHAEDARRIATARELRRLPPPGAPALVRNTAGGAPRLLLAGLAAARHGTVEALAVLDALADAHLYVRPGEGMEPRDLLDHPRVSAHAGEPIDVVLAPAWTECYPSEVPAAAAADVPVVGTRRAAGFTAIREHAPGDVASLLRAVTGALGPDSSGHDGAKAGKRTTR